MLENIFANHDNSTKFLNNMIAINNKIGTILNKREERGFQYAITGVARQDCRSLRLFLIFADILGKLHRVQKFQLADTFQIYCTLR